ncbi:unnamed protein product [Paramecium primaurelia]|uniref:Tetratricopeptide repeat protein n=1 Tax=Paramecium primaurelia TaxID=5886 RepID=A0A8S1MDK9_PARPR|nr:unnamed protein product [Paramecium primaurelia]CAD8078348.1 unnamed protein product [Paramecium primaurelia]CAD8114445.1 unnamed protein product [Paramecium primaurelia]CAD8117009.1 unnamed protein product [Paramecium primaurelia]
MMGTAFMFRTWYNQNEQMNDDALRDFNQALKMNPKYALAYNYRAILFKDIGGKDKELSDYQQGFCLSLNDPLLLCNLGDYYYILSDHTQQTLNVLKRPQILYRGQNNQKW